MCPGIDLHYEAVEGAKEALEDDNSPVGSIYREDLAWKTARLREKFTGGKAVFTVAPPPIKCGSAPQKIMYLCESYWRRKGIRNQIEWYTPAGVMFGNCAKNLHKFEELVRERKVETHFGNTLAKIDKTRRKAYFINEKKQMVEVDYDFLHVVPH